LTRRGTTLVEVVMTASLLVTLSGALLGGLLVLGRQTRHAVAALDQLDEVNRLQERIRRDLGDLVVNPFAFPQLHANNSFVISTPSFTSIQLVTQRPGPAHAERQLVSWNAVPAPGGEHLLHLTRTAWQFRQPGVWSSPVRFPPGWPQAWVGDPIGPVEDRWSRLRLRDIRWEYLPPSRPEGRTFFRVRLVVLPEGAGAPDVFTLMMGLYTPDPASKVAGCPCAFARCFDPRFPDCDCCNHPGAP